MREEVAWRLEQLPEDCPNVHFGAVNMGEIRI
jgi:hypothetical protein